MRSKVSGEIDCKPRPRVRVKVFVDEKGQARMIHSDQAQALAERVGQVKAVDRVASVEPMRHPDWGEWGWGVYFHGILFCWERTRELALQRELQEVERRLSQG